MSDRCKGKTWDGWNFHQCSYKSWRDGYCKIHHSEKVALRQKKASEAYESRVKNSPLYLAISRADKAEAERDRLKAALEDVLAATSCSPQNPWKNCKAQEYNSLEHYDGHIREAKAILEKALASCKDGDA